MAQAGDYYYTMNHWGGTVYRFCDFCGQIVRGVNSIDVILAKLLRVQGLGFCM
jgi:hypothetical protein